MPEREQGCEIHPFVQGLPASTELGDQQVVAGDRQRHKHKERHPSGKHARFKALVENALKHAKLYEIGDKMREGICERSDSKYRRWRNSQPITRARGNMRRSGVSAMARIRSPRGPLAGELYVLAVDQAIGEIAVGHNNERVASTIQSASVLVRPLAESLGMAGSWSSRD